MKNFNILLLGDNESHLQTLLKSLSKKKNDIDDNVIQHQELRVTKSGNQFIFHLKIMNQYQNLKEEMNLQHQDLIIVCYELHSQNAHKNVSKFLDEIYSTRKVVQIILLGIQSHEGDLNQQPYVEGMYQNYQKFYIAVTDQRKILVMFKNIFNYLIEQTDDMLNSELNRKRELQISIRRENQKKDMSSLKKKKSSNWLLCCKQ